MENTNNKLLHALRNSGAEKIFEAYHWVQEHRNEFNKEVYGPVLLEVHSFFSSCFIHEEMVCSLFFLFFFRTLMGPIAG